MSRLPELTSEDMEETFLHVKSGKRVVFVREAIFECDLSVAVLYREVGSDHVWVRPKAEFYDGRFVKQ